MDIAALKASAELATPGPWHVQHDDEVWTDHYVAGTSYHEPDARFIALANPTSILSMIARLEALEEALREAEAFNAEHGDVAATLHHGNAILAFFRAEPVQS
jgi:hypothetical protein